MPPKDQQHMCTACLELDQQHTLPNAVWQHIVDLHTALYAAHDIMHRLIPRYAAPLRDIERITTNYVTRQDVELWDRANGHLAPMHAAAPCVGQPTPNTSSSSEWR